MQLKTLGYVVEWSPRQRCFHVQPLAAAVAGNFDKCVENLHDPNSFVPDYIPVMILPTHADAQRAAQVLQDIRDGKPIPPAEEILWPA